MSEVSPQNEFVEQLFFDNAFRIPFGLIQLDSQGWMMEKKEGDRYEYNGVLVPSQPETYAKQELVAAHFRDGSGFEDLSNEKKKELFNDTIVKNGSV